MPVTTSKGNFGPREVELSNYVKMPILGLGETFLVSNFTKTIFFIHIFLIEYIYLELILIVNLLQNEILL